MTSFVHLEYSTQHPGVARMESAIDSAQKVKRHFSGPRGLSTLLLSAVAAAVMVVAYQVMDSMADGHLLVLWIGLWAVAFATLAICASTARAVAGRLKASLDGWSRNVAAKRADERLWTIAKTDARVMADLQCAISRGDETLTFVPPPVQQQAFVVNPALPVVSRYGVIPAYKPLYI